MTKNDVIDRLMNGVFPHGYAEVLCDIACGGVVCYPNESILVRIEHYDGAVNDDQIDNRKHYTICDSVDDFDEGIVYGSIAAREAYCRYYVEDFTDVRPFKSDFGTVGK